MKEIQAVMQQLDAVRNALIKGDIYQSIPEKILVIMDSVQYKPRRTHIVVPDDHEAVLKRIAAIDARIKTAGKKATISDAELDDLLVHIASPDPLVRDKGVFYLFNRLLRQTVLTPAQLIWVKDRLLQDDYLFAHILEPENDAVFLRSFSVMFLAGILYANRTFYHVFSEAELLAIERRIMTYAIVELDLRGYVDGKGWAHAMTHIINVWSELNEAEEIQRADKILMLAVVLQAYRFSDNALAYGEDSHLTNVLISLMNKHQLYVDYCLVILQEWQRALLTMSPQDTIAFWNRWYNRNRFLQSLLVQPELPEKIATYLRKISDLF
ncbi:DUF2785 domain-containing protein [Latilactobacillus graminis]|uniref:DUF2785 domain-containing protein n=2 Tax=Latilactobacillus graminis TaxID=60519 RepID=A0AA89I0F7_9LACO|nr:DUF2785 domain-containing protein [Latilactobacillus graminis]KRM22302.1 hypothetical protein FC90_GL000901 [Latilactobacillus graminis DSM 20719]QFP79523.1 DUF2785 domain-containing protein [Latilactobacillus graminis]